MAAGNPYRGEVEIEVAGEPYTLRFDWHAIARLRRLLGDNHDEVLMTALEARDTPTIAEVVAIGTGGRLTAAEIMEASPPLNLTSDALLDALRLAYYGPAGAPEDTEEGEGQGKKPKARTTTWWRRFIGRLFGRDSRASSGP